LSYGLFNTAIARGADEGIMSLVIDGDAMSKYIHSLSAVAQGFALTSLALIFSASQRFCLCICVNHCKYIRSAIL
jgi:hypothetical protein